jgi:RNA polymerase sigma-70 factor (ECF subfamily)
MAILTYMLVRQPEERSLNTEEQDWLSQARKGDDEAFACLVERFQNPVYHLCYRMLDNATEAEDAAQETFWRAYQALSRYDPARPFATWLLSIAAHYCIDQQRRRKLPTVEIDAFEEFETPDYGPGPETLMAQSDKEQAIRLVLDELNPTERAAIIMRYWHEMSEEEISVALNLTVSAVKSRLHRARKLLAEKMADTLADVQEEENEYEPSTV